MSSGTKAKHNDNYNEMNDLNETERKPAGRRDAKNARAAAGNFRSARGTKKRKKKATRAQGTGRRYKTSVRQREATIYTAEALAILAAIGCVVGYLLWRGSFTKIKLADYTVLTLSGYDQYGSAQVDVDVDPAYPDFWSTVSARVDVDKNLSNGDSVVISYIFDEKVAKDSRLRVDGTDATVSVSGLPESRIVDNGFLFSGLEVTQEGISPKISLEASNVSDDPFLSRVNYYVDSEQSFFSNDESVPIVAEVPQELFDSHEYVMADASGVDRYDYVVKGSEYYVTDAGVITDEVLTELENAAIDVLMSGDANEYGLRIFQQEAHIQAQFVGNKTTFKWVNPYVISAYFHSVTEEGGQYVENHVNDVQIVIGVTIAQQNGTKAFAEAVVQFTNLVADSDGNLDLSLDTGRLVSCTYKDKNVKELVRGDSDGNYNTTKLTE